MKKPQLRCTNCDHINRLLFYPLKHWQELENVKCERCKEYAYWRHYFTLDTLMEFYKSGWDRKYLGEFVSFGWKQTGRKAPHSVSI